MSRRRPRFSAVFIALVAVLATLWAPVGWMPGRMADGDAGLIFCSGRAAPPEAVAALQALFSDTAEEHDGGSGGPETACGWAVADAGHAPDADAPAGPTPTAVDSSPPDRLRPASPFLARLAAPPPSHAPPPA